MSYALMLKPNWPGTFRRSLRDEQGNVVKVCVFEPGRPILVSDDEFAVLQDDIGKALVYAKRDAVTGDPIPKVDAFDGEPSPWPPSPDEVGSDESSVHGESQPSDEAPTGEPGSSPIAKTGGKKKAGKKS